MLKDDDWHFGIEHFVDSNCLRDCLGSRQEHFSFIYCYDDCDSSNDCIINWNGIYILFG